MWRAERGGAGPSRAGPSRAGAWRGVAGWGAAGRRRAARGRAGSSRGRGHVPNHTSTRIDLPSFAMVTAKFTDLKARVSFPFGPTTVMVRLLASTLTCGRRGREEARRRGGGGRWARRRDTHTLFLRRRRSRVERHGGQTEERAGAGEGGRLCDASSPVTAAAARTGRGTAAACARARAKARRERTAANKPAAPLTPSGMSTSFETRTVFIAEQKVSRE